MIVLYLSDLDAVQIRDAPRSLPARMLELYEVPVRLMTRVPWRLAMLERCSCTCVLVRIPGYLQCRMHLLPAVWGGSSEGKLGLGVTDGTGC